MLSEHLKHCDMNNNIYIFFFSFKLHIYLQELNLRVFHHSEWPAKTLNQSVPPTILCSVESHITDYMIIILKK